MDEKINSFEQKITRCREIISRFRRVALGFSGGVDSTALLALTAGVIYKKNVIAVTASGFFHSKSETSLARRLAERLGVEWVEINMDDIDLPEILSNSPQRCYYCKKYIFSRLLEIARGAGCDAVFSGANADDLDDFRPGLRAEEELRIVRPFMEAGMTKNDVRRLAKKFDLPNADKPSQPCLASRIPYDTPLTREAFELIERGEEILREKYGYAQNRLRYYGGLARLELPADVLPFDAELEKQIITDIMALGFEKVEIDPKGFRSGSLNEGK